MSTDSTKKTPSAVAGKPHLHVVGGSSFDREQAAQDGYGLDQVIERLTLHLEAQLSLCDALERFADNLPENVTNDECLVYAQSVYPAVHRAHQFEENVLFPLLGRMAEDENALTATLDRLHAEHWEDESYAEEIAQALKDFAAERSPDRANTLGYMVRGFFEGLRRHIAFEREHILPILEKAA